MTERPYFLLQLTSPAEIDLAKTISARLNKVDFKTDVQDVVEAILDESTFTVKPDWVEPLIAELKGLALVNRDPIYSPMFDFIEKYKLAINNDKPWFMGLDISDNISAIDVKPHTRWVPILIARMRELHSKMPRSRMTHIASLAHVHPSHNIPDDRLFSLAHIYREEFSDIMTFAEFIEDYIHSRNLNIDAAGEILPERKAEMLATLAHLDKANGQHDDTYLLTRNYNVHEAFKPIVADLVAKFYSS